MSFSSNLHTHTQFDDGKATAEEMVQEAIRRGFVSLGFSGHSPLCFDSGYAMEDEQSYIQEIKRLQHAYGDQIDIVLGIELDYDTPYRLADYQYAIGSVHQMNFKGKFYSVDYTREELVSCIHDVFHDDPLAYAEQYYNLMVECALRPEVDIVGHFDLLLKCAPDLFVGEKYQAIAQNAMRRILNSGKDLIFEYNTGGMYRVGLKEPYPAAFLLEDLKKHHAKLTVTTDAHDIPSLAYKTEDCVKFLRDFGFDTLWRIRSFGFESVTI